MSALSTPLRPRTLAVLCAAMLAGCAHQAPTIAPVEAVELPRFMGTWYVIAHIPTFVERDAYNAVERYQLDDDGRIRTTYTQRKGGFDADESTMHPIGRVVPGTGDAVWTMQFVWPIRAEYVITYVDAGYTQTIIGRSKRDHAWIMARTPSIPEADYQAHLQRLREMGYSLEDLRRVPQRWPE
ncbi:lipocalin family protein [Lysobacter spongiae]|uniref:Outer membrane lipoprotein Blc n=2 Tax=Marilutibacter spongiae TaxID=2025720 RepID=A0A7W3TKU4_9GAMM|nr:lipocalin family protein [Lysobacter spongiae]